MGPTINGLTILQDDHHIGDPVVGLPIGAPVTDVGPRIDLGQAFLNKCSVKNGGNLPNYPLMSQIGHRWHDVNSFPHFIVKIDASTLPVLNKLLRKVGIQNTGSGCNKCSVFVPILCLPEDRFSLVDFLLRSKSCHALILLPRYPPASADKRSIRSVGCSRWCRSSTNRSPFTDSK